MCCLVCVFSSLRWWPYREYRTKSFVPASRCKLFLNKSALCGLCEMLDKAKIMSWMKGTDQFLGWGWWEHLSSTHKSFTKLIDEWTFASIRCPDDGHFYHFLSRKGLVCGCRCCCIIITHIQWIRCDRVALIVLLYAIKSILAYDRRYQFSASWKS